MMSWWHYLLLVNFYLVLFFGFYRILLRKETFFQLNRVYLVSAALLSFFIPLIQSEWVHQLFITQRVQQTIYSTVDPNFIYRVKPMDSNPITLGEMLGWVYMLGAAALSARLAYQLVILKYQLKEQAQTKPFSFFGKIYVDESQEGKETIIAHEEVHAAQWHSADVLLIEAIMIINWFNPVVYLYRKAIKHVHEFIADRKAVENGTSKAEYAMLLVSQTFGTSPHQLTNTFFNHSLLKQRIMMLNQDESSRRKLLKYGLSAPLFMAMLIFSSATVNNSTLIRIINKKTDQALAITTVHFNTQSRAKAAASLILTVNKPVAVKTSPAPAASITLTSALTSKTLSNDTLAQNNNNPVFTVTETIPTFPGGQAGFSRFLSENIHYPEKAKEANVSGRVFIQFVIEKDGSLTDFKTLRDPGAGLGDEAERVLAMSPKWLPGIQNGHPVRVQYTVPVNFSLVDDAPKKPIDTVVVRKTENLPKRQTVYIFKTSLNDTIRQINFNRNPSNKTAISIKKSPFGGNTLILVDGKEVDRDAFVKLDPKSISAINVFKDEAAKIYGDKGKNGVVSVQLNPVKN